ncbi:flagellar biosynthesis protein FlhB [Agrobacterium rubi]|uniref:Flagellar biosynthetic protein FlhB n=1 Tax=Agrobacterium rubi TaxID=28099 RepID=A0AAE7R3G7_9HYPH|nr:flagellar biosynthesis protein FlhB [Agrobacterium rubi]MCL6652442.1 flagellar biosynthesis protein FlhB [Agrobacterium rubi]NTE85358.1 flagellar biosynthesis protein FlhB [Agrobacterium rubi]NTF01290.1 flagellar biosynthesis protein FlhB [Agrobacterium rubi]NTF06414.1 flagellar biosynthesis protein FlhB [Agrobacterium rubi]NTF18656.1 flagellar biosynthesis protein FlhB [Agrobacterium rubi]
MSDGEDKDSKTEDATEKKMSDAMEKGNVPSSHEASLFASTLAFYIYLVFFVPDGIKRLGETLKDIIERPEQWRLNTAADLVSLGLHLSKEMSALLMPAAIMLVVFGLGQAFAQNLPQFVLDRITPQVSRISVVKGFQRIYSVNGMVNFGKSLFKVVVVAIIMVMVLKKDYYNLLNALMTDPHSIMTTGYEILKKMVIVVLFSTGILAVGDYFWTKYKWHSDLRMTKQEIKDEHKQSQGDPVVKARQRSIARDRARRRMMDGVPRATLVITNPTHYAVALRYVKEESDAPIVVAKGQDLIALRIREIATENGIPIFEDPPLARSMFAQVSVDSVIPSVFYKAVAELIHKVYAARQSKRRVN